MQDTTNHQVPGAGRRRPRRRTPWWEENTSNHHAIWAAQPGGLESGFLTDPG
jgi:hypothetical protein